MLAVGSVNSPLHRLLGVRVEERADGGSSVSAFPQPAGSPLLTAEVTADSQEARARLVGELDLATAAEVTDLADELIRAGHRRLVLDLTELDLCDARGLAALLAADQALTEVGGCLTMTGLSPLVREVLEITELATVLHVR
jgi:anti-anti-sigma factor